MSRLAQKHARAAVKPSAHRNPAKKQAHASVAVAHQKRAHGGRAGKVAKGVGGFLGNVFKGSVASDDRAAAMMEAIKSGNITGAIGGEVSSLLGHGSKRSAAPAGMFGGRHRHTMNVGNVKALRRSMRRVEGFAKLAHRVMTFKTHHKLKTAKGRKR